MTGIGPTSRSFSGKRLIVFGVDVALIMTAYTLAFLLRFDFQYDKLGTEDFLHVFAVVIVIKAGVFLFSNMYRNLWRYASLEDVFEILKVVVIAKIFAILGLFFFGEAEHLSRSVFIIDAVLLFCFVCGSRLVWRLYRDKELLPRKKAGKCTLIVGAGPGGSLLYKELLKNADCPYHVTGFIDDDREKVGMRLHGVPVLGTSEELDDVVRRKGIQKVIIAIPSASHKDVSRIMNSCRRTGVRFKILPPMDAFIRGEISLSQVKDVEIEDLLGRQPVVLDEARIKNYLDDKKVLITGAGGSIGSELCRQVARFRPYKLILFDNSETPLYRIEKELAELHPDLRIVPVIGDARDRERVYSVFGQFLPDVVFHAAAYKHVPMMEYNPIEAITNNIGGTRVVADAAHHFWLKNFVMVSTDKAVNPTNVMGATKRAAERYVQALARKSSTKFTTVRFGNVLGSNGSVIPLFKEQIRNGGPVTVTDPQMTRFFMTIPEASQLVLQAGCLGNGGDIFVLDMGEPVRIADLAEDLIQLSGLVPYKDIDIVFTGLRPGEKLFEEILINGEGVQPTVHNKIKVLSAMPTEDFNALTNDLNLLQKRASASDIAGVMESLKTVVPEFNPQYIFTGTPPHVFRMVRPDIFPRHSVELHLDEDPSACPPARIEGAA